MQDYENGQKKYRKLPNLPKLRRSLLRKRSWIGDYEGRQAAGLWIASTGGKVE